ncbi:carboxymuconolactone decarboxylase family protein [Marinobacter sp. C2H3]|uniref:carboxymuconolactone decarboxylase family protein n=1 Tax=Marinobacter sp. C2H3 TaxID=3119003 RepID=UPI00300EC19C
MKSRLPLPDVAGLSVEQRQIFDSILQTRGNLDGPFLAWLHSPGFARRAEQLGAFCRYDTSLSLCESELLILCVAAHHACVGEQQIHEPIAARAGISALNIERIRNGRVPEFSEERLNLLYHTATELLRSNRISGERFAEAEALLGRPALVEAVGVIGYYSLVAYTLNAFEMGVA